MRSWSIGVILVLMATQAIAMAPTSFSGEWKAEWCDNKRPDRECGTFVVALVQLGRAVCGGHHGATLGLSRIDEGSDDLVVGVVTGNKLSLQITSGRSGDRYSAKAVRNGRALDWRVGELVSKNTAGYEEDLIIPLRAKLRRVTATSLHAAVVQKCRAHLKNAH